MSNFSNLFENWKTSLLTVAIGITVASLFIAKHINGVSVIGIGVLLWIIVWLTEGQWKDKFLALKQPWLWFPMILFLLYVLGISYSENPAEASVVFEHKMLLLLAPLFAGTSATLKREHLGFALLTFVLSSALTLLIAYPSAIWHGFQNNVEAETFLDFITYENLASATGFQPIYLSLYVVFAFFALFALYRDEQFSAQWFYLKHQLSIPLLVVFVISVVLLSSRMELLVLFATTLLVILVFVKDKKLIFKSLVIIGATVLIALVLILSSSVNRERFTEMFDLQADYTENKYGGRSVRIEKWKNTIECWSQSPIFGVGTGDMQTELNKTYAKNDFQLALENKFNPHNQYLETGLAIGILGFLSLLGWMASMLWLGFKTGDKLLFAFGCVAGLSMITESMLERQWGITFISIFSSLLIGWNLKYFRSSSSTPSH